MNLKAKHYPLEEAVKLFPDLLVVQNSDVDFEEKYFALTVWHGNIDWYDDWPSDGIVIVTDADTGYIKYVLPGNLK